jgi:tetratricopeptide (TPR) repeat protein
MLFIWLAVLTPPFAAASNDFDRILKQGRLALSAADLNSAQTLFNQACAGNNAETHPPQQTALCEHEIGVLEETRGHSGDAEKHYLKALAIWEDLSEDYQAPHAGTLMSLSGIRREQHRLGEAEALLTKAIALAERSASDRPELYPMALSRLGSLYADSGQLDRARRTLNEAITKLEAITPVNKLELAYAWSSLGMADLAAADYKSAEAGMRKALAYAGEIAGEDHPEVAAYQANLGLALLMQGQYDRAEPLLRRALFVMEKRIGPDSARLAGILAEITTVEAARGRFAIAEDYGKREIAIANQNYGADSIEMALAHVNLAAVYIREHDPDAAEKILPQAIETERVRLGNTRFLADGIRTLAELRAEQHAWKESEALYREAIGLYESTLGSRHPNIVPVLRACARVMKLAGCSKQEVKTIEARANAIAAARG